MLILLDMLFENRFTLIFLLLYLPERSRNSFEDHCPSASHIMGWPYAAISIPVVKMFTLSGTLVGLRVMSFLFLNTDRVFAPTKATIYMVMHHSCYRFTVLGSCVAEHVICLDNAQEKNGR